MKGSQTALRAMVAAMGAMTVGSLAAAASPAGAFLDAKIAIDRAAGSPTLTVKYSGAATTLVELRVNGQSLATKAVTSTKDAGEASFTLALANLKDGDNEVEIRLFDKSGTLIGTQKSTIKSEAKPDGPITLTAPKTGATVQGPVEMTIGFGKEMKNVFVSFFVDSDFKAMTNFPPYAFTWDSTTATNGWHDLEAWAVTDDVTTYKSRKLRVFVNNPGGRTERVGLGGGELSTTKEGTGVNPGGAQGARPVDGGKAQPDLTPDRTALAPKTPTAPKTVPIKPTAVKPVAKAAPVKVVKLAPKPVALDPIGNRPAGVSGPAGVKARPVAAPIALGSQSMTPTGTRVVRVKAPVVKAPALRPVVAPAARLTVARGTRLPNVATFSVVMNDRYIDFDVAPRVDQGIPMTPFRHLIEGAGGNVDWANGTKTVSAFADGREITVRIGDANARLGTTSVRMETAAYLDRGRTIVPLSFLSDALGVAIEFDRATNHVLITSAKKTSSN